ncbi:hypothetical protein LFL97_21700 [Burkholderia sp. JSH-S8]|nr:hypothetical protein LFL97_21700 [Burkholderia sp. JSH-S8]
MPSSIVASNVAASKVMTRGLGGTFVWPAWLRKPDRRDDSYRT